MLGWRRFWQVGYPVPAVEVQNRVTEASSIYTAILDFTKAPFWSISSDYGRILAIRGCFDIIFIQFLTGHFWRAKAARAARRQPRALGRNRRGGNNRCFARRGQREPFVGHATAGGW